MTNLQQPSINLDRAPARASFDDAVAAGPYDAPSGAGHVLVTNAGAQTLNLPLVADGASVGQTLVVQQLGLGLLTVNVAVPGPVPLTGGQTALLVANSDGAGDIAWTLLIAV